VFEGGGAVGEYVGGYTDWVRQRKPPAVAAAPTPSPKRQAPPPPTQKTKPRRLTFKETTELAGLPDRIDALERERDALYLSLADPAVLRDGSAVVAARSRLVTLETEIIELTERWETLETIAALA
jgi:ATP-binding cassette subfamily F protein uup